MKILSIKLKNIKSHRDAELTFSAGINVLSGPNGVGKSTIFEAIGYALFGVDAQSFVGNVERFISIGAKKGAIEVEFEVVEGRFRVSRTVGTPANWLLKKELAGGFEVEEHKDIKETESRLKELLGLESGRSLAEQFELVIGPFQHEFLGPFIIKQPAKRRDKFDEILGIDTWRKTFNETKVLASTIKAKTDSLNSAIGPLKEQLTALPEKRDALKTAKQDLAQTEKDLTEKGKGLKELASQLIGIDKSEQLVKDLRGKIDALKVRVDNGKEKIARQKTLIDESEKAKTIVAENSAGKEAYEETEKLLLQLRGQLKAQRLLEQEASSLDKQVAALAARNSTDIQTIELAEKSLKTEQQELDKKRKALTVDETVFLSAGRVPEIREALNKVRALTGQLDGRRSGLEEGSEKLAEGICPFFQDPCLNIEEKPPEDVFSKKFTELELERKAATEELARLEEDEAAAVKAKDQLKAREVELKGLDEQAARLAEKRKENEQRSAGLNERQKEQAASELQLADKQQALKAYTTLQADTEAAEAEQKTHQEARDLYMANQEQAAKLEGLLDELQTFEQLLAQLQQEQTTREAELVRASEEYNAAEHRQLRDRKDALSREVGALSQKIEGLKKDVLRLSGEIEKLKRVEQEIASKQARIKSFSEKEKLIKFLRNRVFRNVSSYLSERFREEISQRANRIYRIIAEVDEELAWGEDYRILLRDMVDGELRERADDQLSGGQTMSAVVALRLAMLQTIGARIAFFDEPTSNLDATRRENLARAFRAIDVGKEEVTEHWYDQLFLISHDVAFTEVTDQILDLDLLAKES